MNCIQIIFNIFLINHWMQLRKWAYKRVANLNDDQDNFNKEEIGGLRKEDSLL